MFVRSASIVSEGASWFRAISDDPQFVVSLKYVKPRYCLFELDGDRDALDPVLYFDWGEGFSEEDSISLQYSGASLYVLHFGKMRHPVRVRLDPATRPCRFRFAIRRVFFSQTPALVIEKAKRSLISQRCPIPTVVDVDTAKLPVRGYASTPKAARRISDYYRHVIGLSQAAVNLEVEDSGTPLLSIIVPTYNTPVRYLEDLVSSYRAQRFPNAELILSDDGSTDRKTLKFLGQADSNEKIVVLYSDENTGIAGATNRGLQRARGEWITFVDHDDSLTPQALNQVSSAIRQFPKAHFFYTDEVITDKDLKPVGYLLKPSFDSVLLSGVNYINHLSIYRRERIAAIGGLRSGFDGSQDFDMLLRYLALLTEDEIVHIPYPAYLWRRTPSAFSTKFLDRSITNARHVLSDHFENMGHPPIEAALEPTLHRPRFDIIIKMWPKVSVVIPSRDSFELISRVLHDLRDKTDYPNLEVIVSDNGSTDPAVLELYSKANGWFDSFCADIVPEQFNFARQINRGVRRSTGEYVLLLNNDVEVMSSGWLKEMVSCFAFSNVGIVGARLLYPNKTLQHAGVIVGLGNLAGHWFWQKSEHFPGPFARLRVRQSLSAVTAACMLISRKCFDDVGPFDQDLFAIAYNDVDFCLRARVHFYRTIWTPFSTLIHHESVSRGSDDTPQNRERFNREKQNLLRKHSTDRFEDPAFSPWYTLDRSEPGLRLLDILPLPRSGGFVRIAAHRYSHHVALLLEGRPE